MLIMNIICFIRGIEMKYLNVDIVIWVYDIEVVKGRGMSCFYIGVSVKMLLMLLSKMIWFLFLYE